MSDPKSAIPDFVTEPATGVVSGDELKKRRALRPTDERIGRLEEKHDAVDAKLDGIDVRVARMEGKLDTALSVLVPDRKEAQVTERARFMSRDKVIVGVVSALCTGIAAIVVAIVSQGCS